MDNQAFYSKHGFLIEYPSGGRIYIIYVFLRFLAYMFDYGIPVILQYVLYSVFNINFIYSTLTTFILFFVFYSSSFIVLEGRTPGMLIAKLRVVHKSGFMTMPKHYFSRALITIIYALPYANTIAILVSAMFIVITRGFTFVDLISGTIVVTETKYTELSSLEKDEKNKEEVCHY